MADRSSIPRGRPRDPGLEDRVYDAAMALYAEVGWAGFNFEGVSRRAGVGKAGLYSRWADRYELLRQTLEARWLAPGRIDTGSLRGDLLALARALFAARTGAYGRAAFWMAIDAQVNPAVRAATKPYIEAAIRQGRAIVRRAIARGEIPPDVNPGLLMDVVAGGVTNHIATTPARLHDAMIAKAAAFTAELVDAALRGVGAAADTHLHEPNSREMT